MTDVLSHDTATVRSALEAVLPPEPEAWPGGYPDDVELALIDAVLSVRTHYGQPRNGVRGRTAKWRDHRAGSANDLAALAGDPDLAAVLDTTQKLGGGKVLKTDAIREAARRLSEAGLRTAADVVGQPAMARSAYTSVRGLGGVTFAYFMMLAGAEGVKADTWVLRFLEQALERPVGPTEGEELLRAAAEQLGHSPKQIDHLVWKYMRG